MRARWAAAVVAVASLVFGSAAMADNISIGLQESGVNGGGITVVALPSTGNTSFSGGYGTFVINNISGTGSPFLAEGSLDSNSLNASSTSAGSLTVYVTAQDVTLAGLPGVEDFLSTLTENSLTSGWSVTESTYVDSGDGQFTTTTPLSSATFTAVGNQSLGASANITSQPFSITEVYTINATGSGSDNSTVDVAAIAAVPEPGILIQLALSLALLGGLLFARRRVFA